MTMTIEFTIGMAALHASLHGLRIAANNGLASPADIEESLDGITETLENLPPWVLSAVQAKLDPVFAEIRQAAAANWKGE